MKKRLGSISIEKDDTIPSQNRVLLLYCLAALTLSIQFMTCAPIAVILGKVYKQDAGIIGLVITVPMFMYPLLTFPATAIIGKRGVGFSIKLGVSLMTMGSLMRCLVIYYPFYWVILGSTVMGIGRPFIINAQSDFVREWFQPEQRTKIITLLNFLVTIGIIGGTTLSSLTYYGYQGDLEDGENRFIQILLAQGLLSALVFLGNMIGIPRSVVQVKTSVNFSNEIRQLLNIKYIMILIVYSLISGAYKGFGIVLPFMLNLFGFKTSDIASLTIAPIFGGMISCSLVAKLFKSTGRFKPLLCFLVLINIVTLYAFYLGVQSGLLWTLVAVKFAAGFVTLPCSPLIIEWACKVAYPAGDAFTIGMLYSGSTLAAGMFSEAQLELIHGSEADLQSFQATMMFIAGSFGLGLALILLTSESPNHRRVESMYSLAETDKPFRRFFTISDSVEVMNYFLDDRTPRGTTVYDFNADDED